MARSTYFACIDCKVMFWLGIVIPRNRLEYFSRVGEEKRNWQDLELNRVIWKMLADHAGHHLQVLVEWTSEYNEFMEQDGIVEIGGDDLVHDISIGEYLKGWAGNLPPTSE